MQIESETQRIAKRGVFNITFAVNNKNFLTETFLFTHTKLSGKDEAVKDRLLCWNNKNNYRKKKYYVRLKISRSQVYLTFD